MTEYIEREAVKEKIERLRDKCGNNDMAFALNCAVSLTGKIPAADVVPVRHGRWIKDGESGPVCCSECGEEHEWEDYRANYCDVCGAKMDLTDGDEE